MTGVFSAGPAIVFGGLTVWLIAREEQREERPGLFWFSLAIVVASLAALFGPSFSLLPVFVGLALLAAPFWALLAYLSLFVRVTKHVEPRPTSPGARLSLSAAWGALYVLAWWLAVAAAVKTYSAIPDPFPPYPG